MAFVDFLFDYDEKVASCSSSSSSILISRLECKTHTLIMTKMAEIS